MADPVQRKTAEQIRDDITAQIAAETGINDDVLGAVIRQSAYAVGMELDELYFQIWRAERATYIKKAYGQALDDRGADFGVTRRPARKAIGTARFTTTTAATIPIGTLISAPATTARDRIQFVTLAAIAAGGAGTYDVAIESLLTGSEGNLANSAITQIDTAIAGVSAVTNPAATTLGRAVEDDDTYRERILATIDGLSKATIWAIRAEALNFELQTMTLKGGIDDTQTYLEIAEDLEQIPLSILFPGKIQIDNEIIQYTGIDTSLDPQRITGLTRGVGASVAAAHSDGAIATEYVTTGRGTLVTALAIVEGLGVVSVYIDDGTTSGADSELVDLVGKRLKGDGTTRDPGVRPAGVALACYAATIVLVDVDVQIQSKFDYNHTEVAAAVATAITSFLNGRKPGQSLDAYAIACVIMDTPGVETIVANTLYIDNTLFDGSDAADVAIAATSVARAGTVGVT